MTHIQIKNHEAAMDAPPYAVIEASSYPPIGNHYVIKGEVFEVVSTYSTIHLATRATYDQEIDSIAYVKRL